MEEMTYIFAALVKRMKFSVSLSVMSPRCMGKWR